MRVVQPHASIEGRQQHRRQRRQQHIAQPAPRPPLFTVSQVSNQALHEIAVGQGLMAAPRQTWIRLDTPSRSSDHTPHLAFPTPLVLLALNPKVVGRLPETSHHQQAPTAGTHALWKSAAAPWPLAQAGATSRLSRRCEQRTSEPRTGLRAQAPRRTSECCGVSCAAPRAQ